jgi:hypothetical protein
LFTPYPTISNILLHLQANIWNLNSKWAMMRSLEVVVVVGRIGAARCTLDCIWLRHAKIDRWRDEIVISFLSCIIEGPGQHKLYIFIP